ncbi:GntR family transcriptional regulator [Streptomyces sp. BE20]|uniref:GntR family transcriptional regulator n=1 Tax=Streptomyces sp. BE20 TaxID=3002525 RepID=UPI002E766208|nr:GntR family transcriptional regulator [Streptomyces sp. BE20]MEE1821262.1 GntR family transcriptional regulator [Streptomyces sp. BE20]
MGEPLPVERQLCADLQVARNTLRSVVDELVRDGILVRESGRGVFAARPRNVQPRTPNGDGADPGTGGVDCAWTSLTVSFRTIAAGAKIGERLRLSPAAEVLRIVRLRMLDGTPICVERLHLPHALVPQLSADDLEAGSFLELLHLTTPTTAVQTIRPTVVDEDEAQLLTIPLHAPALLVERTTSDADGGTVEYTQSVYRGDRYRVHARLSPSSRPNGDQLLIRSWSGTSSAPGNNALKLDPYWTARF